MTTPLNDQQILEYEFSKHLVDFINDKRFETQEEMVDDFNQWFSIASKAKCRRNGYVHGRWWVAGTGLEKPIRFNSQSLINNKDMGFSLDEFKDIVTDMLSVHKKFHDLRTNYLDVYERGRTIPY